MRDVQTDSLWVMACRREIVFKAHTDTQTAGDEPGGFFEVNYSVSPALCSDAGQSLGQSGIHTP